MKIKTALLTPVKNEVISEFNVTFLNSDDDNLTETKLNYLFKFILDCFNEGNTLFYPNILSIIIGKSGYYEVNLKNSKMYNTDFRKIICDITKEVYKSKYDI